MSPGFGNDTQDAMTASVEISKFVVFCMLRLPLDQDLMESFRAFLITKTLRLFNGTSLFGEA